MQRVSQLRREYPEVVSPSEETAEALRILVVDDSRAQRVLLASSLRRAGYLVSEAACGTEALAEMNNAKIDMVLSDWMMPGMNGPELCQAIRELQSDDYVYFILLTSKNERAEIAQGLDYGADDFLTKPVNGHELRARISAGARIVAMQHELTQKNRLIGDTLDELRGLYDLIDSDLKEANKLQQSLLRERFHDFGTGTTSLLLRSSGRVGGDLVGFFKASETMIGLYSIDVSGHGIASALLTARLAGHLSTTAPEHNIALSHTAGDYYRILPPAEVLARFNRLMSTSIETEHYFTIAFGFLDLKTGQVKMAQAGHPYPVVQRADGSVELHGNGGIPVGLLEDVEYEQFEFTLNPGDRLFVCSDGITECPDPEGTLLDDDGLRDFMVRNRDVSGPPLLEALIWDLSEFHGSEQFPDDVSAVLFEYSGNDEPDS